jgi:hypothetical protein
MPNVFKRVDQATEAVFNTAGSVARFVGREFREHPYTTPFVLLGGFVTAVAAHDFLESWERHKQREIDAQHLAEIATAEQVQLITPEVVESDR